MNELENVLWGLKRREKRIGLELGIAKTDYDKIFWFGEALAIDHAIYLVKRAIRKGECIT